MRKLILLFFAAFIILRGYSQVSFIPIDYKLTTQEGKGLTELLCSSSIMSVKFPLHHTISLTQENNLVTIDNQVIQITQLRFKGYQKKANSPEMESNKTLLGIYSKYEMDYFKTELGIDVINPNNDWVVTKVANWYIWYFRVGKAPIKVDKQIAIQLFASAVIGNTILTINAPVFSDDDFIKAGKIVNDMMENIVIVKK